MDTFDGCDESVRINYLTLNKGYCNMIPSCIAGYLHFGKKGKMRPSQNNVSPFQASGTLALVGAKLTASSILEYG